MTYRDRAAEILSQAESALRGLMSEALTAQAYRDVSSVASAADQLVHVVRELVDGFPLESSAEHAGRDPAVNDEGSVASMMGASSSGDISRSNGGSVKPQRYPHYVRDSERLIKWAWSAKERKPYEHRAPREVVEVLVDSIRKHKGEGKVFEASDLMPLKTRRGEDYPSYQTYLALGWLRDVGAIRKRGRAGYLLVKGTNAARLESLWLALPQVEERS